MSQDSVTGHSFLFALKKPSFLLACLILGLVALGASYLDEDAFISFRVVDNFVHGYGLRWNIDERVQVFTHPLWVLLLIPFHALLADVGTASFLLSWLLSLAAFVVVALPLGARPKLLFGALLLPLLCSQAFTDYLSSGLENPLTFFLLALVVRESFKERPRALSLWLLGSLLALARPDAIVMAAPVMFSSWLRSSGKERLRALGLGLLPLAAWAAFSLVYYGVVFPNPKYAKLGGGIPTARYLSLGSSYLLDSLRNDTITGVGLLAALGFGARDLLGRLFRKRDFSAPLARAALLWIGAGIYLVYVVWVGGDFMAGRHFAAPFFLSVAALAGFLASLPASDEDRVLLPVVGAILLAHFGVQTLAYQRDVIFPREQKRYAVVRAGEIRLQRYNCGFYEALIGARGKPSQHAWSLRGLKEKKRAEAEQREGKKSRYVVVDGGAGKAPFYAGPLVTYVDPFGIVDPLLARLPDEDGRIEIIGHLGRKVPEGYLFARETGSTKKMAAPLARYYEDLRVLTSAPLFSAARVKTILAWNLGRSDRALQAYLEAKPMRSKKRR